MRPFEPRAARSAADARLFSDLFRTRTLPLVAGEALAFGLGDVSGRVRIATSRAGIVKANRYKPFSASNPAERAGDEQKQWDTTRPRSAGRQYRIYFDSASRIQSGRR